MPEYADAAALKAATDELKRCPPLIFAGEARAPHSRDHWCICGAAAALRLHARGERERGPRAANAAGRLRERTVAAGWSAPVPRTTLPCVDARPPSRPGEPPRLAQVRELRRSLAKVANGEAFLLQARRMPGFAHRARPPGWRLGVGQLGPTRAGAERSPLGRRAAIGDGSAARPNSRAVRRSHAHVRALRSRSSSQGGDCAEGFAEFNTNHVRDTARARARHRPAHRLACPSPPPPPPVLLACTLSVSSLALLVPRAPARPAAHACRPRRRAASPPPAPAPAQYRVLLQMALVLQFASGLPVVKLGRVAGQFAKPRSDGNETRDGVSLPSYRGDIINGEEFTAAARVPDPWRMVRAYNQSATTLNLLRAFATGGYSDLARLHAWNLDFCEAAPASATYHDIASRIGDCLRFLEACGVNAAESATFRTTSFYTSHEALLLEYEQALTREDSTTGLWYGCSAHYLWLGERTRQLDGAHIEYLRGVGNPLGVKISDKADAGEVLRLCDALNPENEPGRLTLVCRMGAGALYDKYPAVVRTVTRAGHKVVWQSDPMHGNTFKTANGFKTRAVEAIRDELVAFFDVHEAEGTHAGGIHLEMTGKDVTECVGGMQGISAEDLGSRYHTHCDPRLNATQSLELAFLVGDRMRKRRARGPRERASRQGGSA